MAEGYLGVKRPFADCRLALDFDVTVPNTREGERMLERKAQLYKDAVDISDRPVSHGESRKEAGNHIPNVILSTIESLTKSEIFLENVEHSETRSRSVGHTPDTERYTLTYTIDRKWRDEWAMEKISSSDMVRLHNVFIEGTGDPSKYRNEGGVAWPKTWNPEELEVKSIYSKVY